MSKRDLVSLLDYSTRDILEILDITKEIKKDKFAHKNLLENKSIGLLFQKPSNRTRVSFDVGVKQLGGNCLYLGPDEINLGVRESTSDVSKTLSRYLDCIVARTHLHSDICDLAQYADVPVINGLSDLFHPCQSLTDIFSVQEKLGKLAKLKLAYIGDGNNVCNSLLVACTKVGMDISIATPHGYEPNEEIIAYAIQTAQANGTHISFSNSPSEAVRDANVIYADVWVSMGQENESVKRLTDFADFQINADLVQSAAKDYIFMHCLPAHRGEEVTADIIDGDHSIVFDQAENRLHTQKAILAFLFKQ